VSFEVPSGKQRNPWYLIVNFFMHYEDTIFVHILVSPFYQEFNFATSKRCQQDPPTELFNKVGSMNACFTIEHCSTYCCYDFSEAHLAYSFWESNPTVAFVHSSSLLSKDIMLTIFSSTFDVLQSRLQVLLDSDIYRQYCISFRVLRYLM